MGGFEPGGDDEALEARLLLGRVLQAAGDGKGARQAYRTVCIWASPGLAAEAQVAYG